MRSIPSTSAFQLLRRIRHLLATAILLASWVAAASADPIITLGVGTQKVLPVPGGIQRIAVGDENVADVKSLPSGELLIIGQAEGRTTLLVWRSSGDRMAYVLNVRRRDPQEIKQELLALMGDIEGVTIKIVGDRVYLDGETLTTGDAERVQRIVQLYDKDVRTFVRPSLNATKANARNLERALKDAGLKNISVSVIGETTFLEGSVESKEDIDKASKIVKAMGAQVESLLGVGLKRMVLVEAELYEIRRTDERDISPGYSLGFNYSSVYEKKGGSGSTTTDTGFNYGVSATQSSAFKMRFDAGYGRLLSRPRLVCASGEKAKMSVGGEIPIPIVTANTVTVEFKEFGVIMELTPNADRHSNIQLDINTEVSEVDSSLTVRVGGNEVPGFRKRQVKTNVTVHHNEQIVLSGLFNHDQQKNVSKFPLLGHIPILGELFKSRGFQEKKNELAIIVTPKIVAPDSDRIRETIDKARERYKDAADAVSFSIWD